MNASLLRLFNAVFIKEEENYKIEEKTLKHTVKNGYILGQNISPDKKTIKLIDKTLGLSGKKANSAFHKSWRIIKESSMEDLVVQQMLHYITTYGFEAAEIYEDQLVYVPDEKLKLPDIKNIRLTIIKGITKNKIIEKIISLASGVALSKETLEDIMNIIEKLKLDISIVQKINNRELKTMLYDYYNICPEEPIDYLRFVVKKLTGESLLIKNEKTIDLIECCDVKLLDSMLKKAPKDLGSIFYRFKPLFMAMKSVSNNKNFFNRLSKSAKKQHIPIKEDYLNNVTKYIKNNTLKIKELKERLSTATVFRKIRLANALKYRLSNPNSIVYRIRTGKGYATDFSWESEKLIKKTEKALGAVVKSIAKDVSKNVSGKTFYIPKEVGYTVPATEKQFSGNIPIDSYVEVGNDLIVGVNWVDTGHRIDLDLAMLDIEGKIGWDGTYKTDDCKILFSGDMTSAPKPNGASEFFYVSKNKKDINKILILNHFNRDEDEGEQIEYTLIIGKEKIQKLKSNYIINPNKILAKTKSVLSERQEILGLISNANGKNRFYFSKFGSQDRITARCNKITEKTLKSLIAKTKNLLMLSEILKEAGATIVDTPTDGVIDLSPENLTKTTIIDLIK